MQIEETCKEIVKSLVRNGYLHQVREKDLQETIMKVRKCIDDRTINRWIKALVTFEYLENDAPQIYKINPLKIPDLMAMLHDQSQSRLQ